jgi:hypothetical protein
MIVVVVVEVYSQLGYTTVGAIPRVCFANECVACWSFMVLICSAEEVCMAAAAAPAAVYRAGGRGG